MAWGLIALVANVGAQIYGGIQSQRAANAQQRAANRMADDVLARAEFDVERYEMQERQVLGAQRAIAGAAMIDPDVGSPAAIRAETERIADRDIAQIRLNAEREAWGIRTSGRLNAQQLRNQATMQFFGAAGTALASPAGQTLLTRTEDAWTNFVGRRTLRRAAQGGTFSDPSWF